MLMVSMTSSSPLSDSDRSHNAELPSPGAFSMISLAAVPASLNEGLCGVIAATAGTPSVDAQVPREELRAASLILPLRFEPHQALGLLDDQPLAVKGMLLVASRHIHLPGARQVGPSLLERDFGVEENGDQRDGTAESSACAFRRAVDHILEALQSRRFVLRAHDVVTHLPLIPRRLRLEERPCLLVGAERLLVSRIELGRRFSARTSRSPTSSRRAARKRPGRRAASAPPRSARATRLILIALQMLPLRRGVKRIVYASSSTLLRTPSIQPTHNASSTDSGQVMLGLPLSFL